MHIKFWCGVEAIKWLRYKDQLRGFVYTVTNILVRITKLGKELINYVNNYQIFNEPSVLRDQLVK